eukprot:c9850_g1_i1.p1 GENE.c9850_g1_i1~~c9850_g1_i1.p1  ORF type:complete len:205 (-),score=51.91 c9850_g1_i1:349-963(-)
MRPDYDYLFILVLIGDSGVGKSSLLNQFSENTFTDNYIMTSGIDLKVHSLEIDGRSVRLQIWDTAGQERFRSISSTYYRGAHGIVIVYDITNPESFNNVSRWLADVAKFAKGNVNKILVGNKLDLASARQVTEKEAMDFASSNELAYVEASARTGANVGHVFETLTKQIRKRMDGTVPTESKPNALPAPVDSPNTKPKSGGCAC